MILAQIGLHFFSGKQICRKSCNDQVVLVWSDDDTYDFGVVYYYYQGQFFYSRHSEQGEEIMTHNSYCTLIIRKADDLTLNSKNSSSSRPRGNRGWTEGATFTSSPGQRPLFCLVPKKVSGKVFIHFRSEKSGTKNYYVLF